MPRVALFVTCLVDMMRPSIAHAAVKLLQQAGCDVEVPGPQSCCGQPAYNAGDQETSRKLARQMISLFKTYDYVVAPSGSCAAMLVQHYPALFEEGSPDRQQADDLASRSYELTSFLARVMKQTTVSAEFPAQATYHDSCSGLRELGIKSEPRQLLASVTGLTVSEMVDSEVCCGFGGAFCVKYPDISNAMLEKKINHIEASGADLLLGGDLGCLLNIAGKLKRQNSPVKIRHVAEVLVGDKSCPGIGEGEAE